MQQLCATGLLMMPQHDYRTDKAGKAPLGIILSNPLLNQGCLDQVYEVYVESDFYYLQGWRCGSLYECLVSVLNSYHSKEVYIQVEFPLLHYVHH